jgi:hypothetical protein
MSSLNHDCVSDSLLIQALDEELSPQQAWTVKLHLENCASCQRRLEGLRQITGRVTEYHHSALAPGVAEDEWRMLAARLDQETARQPRRFAWPQTLGHRMAWSAALTMLILAGILGWNWRPHAAVSPVAGRRPAAVPPAPKPLVAGNVPARRARPARVAVKKHARSVVLTAGTSKNHAPGAAAIEEIVTPFFALPFSDTSLPLDRAPVIRVELPRSVLTLAGFPVDGDRQNERVDADVVVGADGLARAIRFVRQIR